MRISNSVMPAHYCGVRELIVIGVDQERIDQAVSAFRGSRGRWGGYEPTMADISRYFGVAIIEI